jgi:aspartate dehydrogenase
MPPRRVGILGYGSLGQHLARAVLASPELELAFVWNRTASAVTDDAELPADAALADIAELASRRPDLVVEVSHPAVVAAHGARILATCDLMVGSPTALADAAVEAALRAAAGEHARAVFVPAGALWGGADLERMALAGVLESVAVTMRKHPGSLKVDASLMDRVREAMPREDGSVPDPVTVYEGPVRALCPLAPNNVNTMACAAIASGPGLGFDRVVARLIADATLEAHIVEIDAVGPGGFNVHTARFNPAKAGAVTGNMTYASFEASLTLAARGRPTGVHLV